MPYWKLISLKWFTKVKDILQDCAVIFIPKPQSGFGFLDDDKKVVKVANEIRDESPAASDIGIDINPTWSVKFKSPFEENFTVRMKDLNL